MNTSSQSGSFPGFEYPATMVRKFLRAGEIFTIMLNDGSIIHHTPDQQSQFEDWLHQNNVINIKMQST